MKDHMLIGKKFDCLMVVGYSNSNFDGYVDRRKSMFGYVFLLAKGAIL